MRSETIASAPRSQMSTTPRGPSVLLRPPAPVPPHPPPEHATSLHVKKWGAPKTSDCGGFYVTRAQTEGLY